MLEILKILLAYIEVNIIMSEWVTVNCDASGCFVGEVPLVNPVTSQALTSQDPFYELTHGDVPRCVIVDTDSESPQVFSCAPGILDQYLP